MFGLSEEIKNKQKWPSVSAVGFVYQHDECMPLFVAPGNRTP